MGIECWVVFNGLQTILVTVDTFCGIACRSSLREGNTICFSCLFSHFIFMKILSIPIVALGVSHWRSTNVGLIQETIKVHVRTEKVNGKTIRKSERVCENSIRLITHVQSGLMMPSHNHTCMHGSVRGERGTEIEKSIITSLPAYDSTTVSTIHIIYSPTIVTCENIPLV